jgi:hypothetical protein
LDLVIAPDWDITGPWFQIGRQSKPHYMLSQLLRHVDAHRFDPESFGSIQNLDRIYSVSVSEQMIVNGTNVETIRNRYASRFSRRALKASHRKGPKGEADGKATRTCL